MNYTFVIERPDGSIYEQQAPDVLFLLDMLGDYYWVVDVY